jgi:hypothetical protein
MKVFAMRSSTNFGELIAKELRINISEHEVRM